MIDKFFFDTDCLSAFLWVREESLLAKLYSGRIILPAQVYCELQKVPHLLSRVDTLKNNGDILVNSIEVDSVEYRHYIQMTTSPEPGLKIIGSGEAACIAMAKERSGILASNNMKDIRPYIEKYKLQYITTGDILTEAMTVGMITEAAGNNIWAGMIQKRRVLPSPTFTEYLTNCKKGKM